MFCAYSYSLTSSYLSNLGRKPHYYCASRTKLKSQPRNSNVFSNSSSNQNSHYLNKNKAFQDLANIICNSGSTYQDFVAHSVIWHKFCQDECLANILTKVLNSIVVNNAGVNFFVLKKKKKCSTHSIECTFNNTLHTDNRNSLLSPLLSNWKFVRHFKTDRSVVAELKRNPSMMSRLKTVFGGSAPKIEAGLADQTDTLSKLLIKSSEKGLIKDVVVVSTPDFTGRKEILSLYLTKVLHDEIDLDMLARGTSGFTGADLENMINQAALRAAIDGAETVTMKHLETARDKVLMGPERKARLPDEEANLITAYHEGGHAVVAYYTKESHPLHKVTIMPRGPSLGHTAYIPEKERYHVTKAQLLAMMDTMMGGRAAEELIFGAEKITSGASSDLKQATSIATHMVKDWGMSEKVGLRTIEGSKGLVAPETLGPNTIETVDVEIKRILTESYERAKAILKKHAKEHKALAEALLKYETLDADDIKAIMNGSQK